MCLALLSGSVSWKILDNPQFAHFVEYLSDYLYKLPSRTYMSTCIVPGVFEACKEGVRAILQNKKHISFTTDAWRSINKDSYITVTAHVIDDNLVLHSVVLDTSEIKKRHTSDNLFDHIKNVLQEWGLNSSADSVALNYNNCNANDIFADEEETDDGVDYMQTWECYDNDDDNLNSMFESQTDMSPQTPMSESQTQMPESQTQMPESQTQMPEDDLLNRTVSQEPSSSRRSQERSVDVQLPDRTVSSQEPSSSSRRSHERSVINSEDNIVNMTFVSDNASDIRKALSVKGQFNSLGCAGHHINLVVKEAFKKVSPAAEILKKCKVVVKTINHSTPILYNVRELQIEFGIGLAAILQEMIVRWWSILDMLKSILKSWNPIIIALHNCNKSHAAFHEADKTKIKDIIELLEPFKVIGEQFSKDSDATITQILPCFKHLENKVLNPNPADSPLIKDMKTHMLRKLNSRYNDQQKSFLSTLTYLDPRFKSEVNPEMTLLISKIKKIVEANGPSIIPPTQDQEYHNLQNSNFASV